MIKRISYAGSRSQSNYVRLLQKQGDLKVYYIDGYLAYDTDEYKRYKGTMKLGRPLGKRSPFETMTLQAFLKNGQEVALDEKDREFLLKVKTLLDVIIGE